MGGYDRGHIEMGGRRGEEQRIKALNTGSMQEPNIDPDLSEYRRPPNRPELHKRP
jgi:hypothetical protein